MAKKQIDLHSSEALLTAVGQHSDELVLVIGKDGSVRHVSPSVARVLDREGKDIQAAGLRGIFSLESIDELMALLASKPPPGSAKRIAMQLIGAHGALVPCEGRIADHQEDPVIQGLLLILYDVRPKRELADSYDQSAADLEVLLGHSGEVVFLLDTELNIRAFNKAAEDRGMSILGVELRHGMSILDVARPERTDALRAMYQRVLDGEELHYPYDVSGSGEGPFLELFYKPTRSNGVVNGIYVEAKDITTRVRADHALKEREADLRALVDNLPEVFWSMDKEGRMLSCNNAFQRYMAKLGAGHVEPGTNIKQVFPEELQVRFDPTMARVLAGENVQWIEVAQGRKGTRHFEVKAHPIRQGDVITGVSVLSREITSSVKHENELRSLKELAEITLNELDKVMECASDMICVLGKDGTILKVNSASYQILGLLPMDMTGRHYRDFTHVEDLAELNAGWAAAQAGSRVVDLECRWKHSQGQAVPLRWSLSFDPSTGHCHAIAVDLTVRKRLESELELSGQRLRHTIDRITDGFFILDHEWRFVESNGLTERAVGIPQNELIGRSIWDVFPNAREEGYFALYDKAMTGRASVAGEIRERSSGVWLEVRAFPVPEGISVFYTDITEKKQAQEALLLANERYRIASNVAQEAHWDWNLEHNTVIWGEGFRTQFGHDLAPGISADIGWKVLVHADDLPRVQQGIKRALDDRTAPEWSDSYRIHCGDGRIAQVHDRGIVLRDPSGRAIRMVGSMRDTTREQAEGIRNALIKEGSLRLGVAQDLKAGFRGVLEVLCGHFGHEVGEIWMPDSAGTKLILQGRSASEEWLGQISDTQHIGNFGMGGGLPGTSFRTGEAVIWNDLPEHPSFLRKELARELGIVHGIAVPLGYAGELPMAIIVLLTRFVPEDPIGVSALISEVGQGLAPEMARRKSEQELTNFFTLTQDLLMVVDSEGVVRKLNPALTSVLGYSQEEVVGKHFRALIHPDDIEAVLVAMAKINQGQALSDFEDRLRDAAGNYHWYVWTTSEPDEEGLVYSVGKNIDVRKEQELHTRELTAELLAFQESITDGLYRVDRDWRITYVNAEAEKLLREERGNLLGKVIWEVFPEARETALDPMYRLALETGEAVHFEVFFPPLNSWYDVNAYPSKNGLSVFFRDITMPRTLQELQELERKALTENMDGDRALESIIDELLKGIDTMLPGIRCSLLVVDSGERTLGHLSSPGLPDTYTSHLENIPVQEGHGSCGTAAARRHEVLSPDIANDPLWKPYRALALAHGLQACWSYPVFATNGRLLATFANYFEVPRSPGQVERMVAERASRTVAALLSSKVADEAERLGNERYQLVSRATNDATWDLDIRTGHWVWGEGFRNRFGHDPGTEPATIASWQDHLHPDDSGRVMHGQRKVLRSPHLSSWEDEYRFIRADGSVAHVLDRGFVIRDDKGVAVRMVGAMQDISDRKEKEMMLRELNGQLIARALELQVSNTELERFAFVASHDLQEPLRMVASFMQLLEKRLHGQLDEKSQEFLRFAVDGAQRMKHLILDLLEYSRLGRRSLSIGEVDMTRMVTQVQNILMEQIRRTGARVEVGTLPIIQADPTRMIQLLQSLVDNALRYRSEANPVITITSEEKGDHWHFSVCDNGIGMEEAYFEKVFMIFQRLDPDRENRSTGIGLTIARKIVEMHGGKIWVDSIPHEGSTFHFTIAKHMGPASASIATRSHVPYTDLE